MTKEMKIDARRYLHTYGHATVVDEYGHRKTIYKESDISFIARLEKAGMIDKIITVLPFKNDRFPQILY